MSLDSLHWCYVWSIMLTSCEPPCCPPESKKSPLNTYQPELHSHSFHCREISVDQFLCCLQRVVNWLRNNSGCFCETLKANRESLAHVWHWKITSLIKLFQSSFLNWGFVYSSTFFFLYQIMRNNYKMLRFPEMGSSLLITAVFCAHFPL